ncbi:hypothetical protein K466DRAFT_578393 [Polyporus arcularius HHB13444]|uniref:Uncharacterized protein n=1 Tax=Polyporus arcularius HHB13444 TaxID=1314778 RepID=A0A5C3NZB0_9APHY|nr:hypothetical protein K466DRAFT_578393 [Polyporus arcularius HHB13444]
MSSMILNFSRALQRLCQGHINQLFAVELSMSDPNFDNLSIHQQDPNVVEATQNSFASFDWDGLGSTSCPGDACHWFPANGLVGGLLIHAVDFKTSPKGSFSLVDSAGSFDLGPFDVFDIIDLPVSILDYRTSWPLQDSVTAGAKENMRVRVHHDCNPAGNGDDVKSTIPFNRNKDSAGYSVIAGKPGSLSSCTISTTQKFISVGKELEIPCTIIANLNVCVR